MKDWIENQWQNMFLYAPFLMAFGAAVYFAMTNEPNLFLAPPITVILFMGLFIKKIPQLIRGALLILFGFYYAATFTNFINTPQIKRNIHDTDISGIVENIDYTYDKNKLTLSVNANDIGAGDGYAKVKVSLSPDTLIPNIGDTVQINGGLYKPKPAAAPETFDYARWAYFNNLTATGYAKELSVINSSLRTKNSLDILGQNNTELAKSLYQLDVLYKTSTQLAGSLDKDNLILSMIDGVDRTLSFDISYLFLFILYIFRLAKEMIVK